MSRQVAGRSITDGSPAGHVPVQERDRLDFVDALRGVAVLGVVAMHVGRFHPELPANVAAIVENGSKGVQMFFVASAFTMFLTLDRRAGRDRRPTVAFALRRICRIAPMYYAALIFYSLTRDRSPEMWTPTGTHSWQIALAALFAQGWHPYSFNSVVPGGWSVAVEMGFYTLVPVLHKHIRSIAGAFVFLIGAGVIAKVGSVVALRVYDHLLANVVHEFAWMYLPGQLPVFALGFLCYFAWRDRIRGYASDGSTLGARRLLATVGVVLWMVLLVVLPGRHLPLLPSYLLYSLGHSLLLLSLGLYPVYLVVNPLVRMIGKVSFSVYLTHFAVMYVFMGRAAPQVRSLFGGLSSVVPFAISYLCVLSLSVLVSLATYRFVEVPGIRLAPRLAEWLDRRGPDRRAEV